MLEDIREGEEPARFAGDAANGLDSGTPVPKAEDLFEKLVLTLLVGKVARAVVVKFLTVKALAEGEATFGYVI